MKEIGIKIGARLRKYRNIKGYSQEYMAEVLHISQKTYSNMENDKTTISINLLKELAKELGVDVMELLSDEKIVVQNNSSQDQSTFQGGIVINHQSAELFAQMKERIEELKDLVKEKDLHIKALERKLNTEK